MKSIILEVGMSADPEVLPLIENANWILDVELGPSSSQVEASWYYFAERESPSIGPVIGLSIKDWSGSVSTVFDLSKLSDPRRVAASIARLWGDLLQVRSHNQLASLTKEPSRLGGDEVIDLISDAIYDYTDKHGDEPHVLKLPIRYAVALMKLGTPFWGDFFQQIRESGVRAIDNQRLLGVPIKLLSGVDAKLEVE